MSINTCRDCRREFTVQTARTVLRCSPCFNAKERNYSARHRATFSIERLRAAVEVQKARGNGSLVPQPCEVCGKKYRYLVAHHDDYAAPLAVRWLCRTHHKQHHLRFGPGKNAFIVQSPAGETR